METRTKNQSNHRRKFQQINEFHVFESLNGKRMRFRQMCKR